jgi:hypothetical protein
LHHHGPNDSCFALGFGCSCPPARRNQKINLEIKMLVVLLFRLKI